MTPERIAYRRTNPFDETGTLSRCVTALALRARCDTLALGLDGERSAVCDISALTVAQTIRSHLLDRLNGLYGAQNHARTDANSTT